MEHFLGVALGAIIGTVISQLVIDLIKRRR